MTSEAPAFDTHPHYRTPCTSSQLTSTLGKRTARQVAGLYPDGMTLADLALEQAIDADSITVLDGAWGPRQMPIAVAANFGLRLTDLSPTDVRHQGQGLLRVVLPVHRRHAAHAPPQPRVRPLRDA
jgi:hypothetical protein